VLDKLACEHDEGLTKIGEMESGYVDGVYVIPFKCDSCGKKVYEEYEYVGIVESIKEHKRKCGCGLCD